MKIKREVVLGINWEQNSTACLMINGKIVACVSEERFSRIKNDERYPVNAINWMIKKFKVLKDEIEAVCFISKLWSPDYILTRHYTNFTIEDYLQEQEKLWYPRIYLNKKVSQIIAFKNRVDVNQFPGPEFWKKVMKNNKYNINQASNKGTYNTGQKIRSEALIKHLGIKILS